MKELRQTPFIQSLLSGVVGEGVDTSKLHVYEVTATSTNTLRGKSGTVFDRAKISPNTIAQLARAVNSDPLPLMMDHNMEGTPYGKFFYAESIPMDNGEIELRGLLYVDESEKDIKTKLDAGSVDEVSIQFLSEHLFCSECGFDYMQAAAEDNYMPFIELTCDEGHKIGENGVHTNIVGVRDAVELSLVSRGAVKNSKIIAPSAAKLGEEAQRLAAAGVQLENFYCTASASDVGEEEVDFEKFMTQLNAANTAREEAVVAAADAKRENETLTATVSSQEETITTLTADKETLETQLSEAQTESEEETSATTTLTGIKEYIGAQFVALKALDGDTDAEILDNVNEMVDYITQERTRLSALVPVGGVAAAAGAGEAEEEAKAKKEKAELKLQADAYRAN